MQNEEEEELGLMKEVRLLGEVGPMEVEGIPAEYSLSVSFYFSFFFPYSGACPC